MALKDWLTHCQKTTAGVVLEERVLHCDPGILQDFAGEEDVSGVSDHEKVLSPAHESALVPPRLLNVDVKRQFSSHPLPFLLPH
ncbi:hypothetical protein JZ751_004404 [Albula glossodonta]|uniref:Uncharacterized protein n=1 Tax=Albula glossodonta TaxID=121402 RepID=A0A8T2N5E9_9TELE|nr:hypothetical protein JZ751_004404 [Albula glossodonta]